MIDNCNVCVHIVQFWSVIKIFFKSLKGLDVSLTPSLPHCKISGLKGAQIHACKQYI